MAKGKNPIRIIPTGEYFTNVRRQLSENGQATVRVTGISMMPLLHHMRDSVVLVPPRKVHTGDIVLFDRLNGRYALHRVIRKKKNGFAMMGDNQWFYENDLPYEQIIGVVTEINRNGKRIAGNSILLKLYSLAVTTSAIPRIYIRKGIEKLLKPFRQSGNQGQEGANE